VSSFSEFWITKDPGAGGLPVTYTDVRATLRGNETLVSWKVSNEQDVRNYEVQHSKDGTNFNTIGSVDYNAGITGNYNYTHASPVDGVNYYRIKQVDNDGHYLYSKVVKVVKTAIVKLDVYPNPFRSTFTINNASNKKGTLQVFGADGKVLLSTPIQPGANKVDGSRFAQGIYVWRVIWADGEIVSGKIVKE
jgi:membrane-bound inhibitor of C-type lysozyme